jgi:hypothetical protein
MSLADIMLRRGFRASIHVIAAESGTAESQASLYLLEGNHRKASNPVRFLGNTDRDGILDSSDRIAASTENTILLALTDEGMGWVLVSSLPRDVDANVIELAVWKGGVFVFEVRDETGGAIPSAEISVTPEFFPLGPLGTRQPLARLGDSDRLFRRCKTSSDAEGRARLPGLPVSSGNGGYTISVSASDFVPETFEHERVPDSHVQFKRVTLRREAVIHRVAGSVTRRHFTRLVV